MSVEKPQLEAFWKSEKGKKSQPEESEELKERKAELEQKAVTLAQEAERAFSSNDLTQTLEKLRELQRTVGMEMVENREQYEKFEQEFNRQIENLSKRVSRSLREWMRKNSRRYSNRLKNISKSFLQKNLKRDAFHS